jgi:hypothetical protein
MPRRLRIFYSCLNAALLLIPAVPLYSDWDRVRAAGLEPVVVYGAVIGALLVMLLLVATGRVAYRGEKPPVEV